MTWAWRMHTDTYAHPPAPVHPRTHIRHPPACYARIHLNDYLLGITPPFIHKSKHPPLYIFLENTKMHTNVRTEEVVDYAYPAMMAERALKRVHDAALDNDFDLAMDEAVNAMAQMRKLHTALCEMQDKQK